MHVCKCLTGRFLDITMEGYGETCQLCGTDGLDLDKGKGDELTEKDHLETFKFLSLEISSGKSFFIAIRVRPKASLYSTHCSPSLMG